MPIAQKIPKAQVTNAEVLALEPKNAAKEAMVGDNFYLIYPLPGDKYSTFMSTIRQIWYILVSEKNNQYGDSVQAAKALATNMGDLDDDDVMDAVSDLLAKLTESTEIHPLEFLSHPKFSEQLHGLIAIIIEGCDDDDKDNLSNPQLARLLEICFIQNFLPFIRLANTTNRVFRE